MTFNQFLATLACLTMSMVAAAGETPEPRYSLDEFDAAVAALQVASPSSVEPLKFNVTIIPEVASPGETVVVVVKVQILNGWDIYDFVPKTEPYIETKWQLEMSEELRAVDDWSGPPSQPYPAMPSLKIHKGGSKPLVFFRELVVTADAYDPMKLSAGLLYQVCEPGECLPPTKEMMDLSLRIKEF